MNLLSIMSSTKESSKDYYVLSKELTTSKCVWKIDQFSKKFKGTLHSENYESKGVKWIWILMEDNKSTDIELYMTLMSEIESIFILNVKCLIYSTEKVVGKMEKNFSLEKMASTSKFRLGELGSKKELKANYLNEDMLEIHFETTIRVFDMKNTITIDTISHPSQTFSKQIGDLLGNGKLADVIITVEGKEIQAHKAILSARSSVFSSMFEGMKESENENFKSYKMELEEDIKYFVMEEFLRFIYTGKVFNLESTAIGLIQVADKYAIEDLREICELHLISKISTGNALKFLQLSDETNALKLKKVAIGFINANKNNLRSTSEWKELEEDYPKLIIELYAAV